MIFTTTVTIAAIAGMRIRPASTLPAARRRANGQRGDELDEEVREVEQRDDEHRATDLLSGRFDYTLLIAKPPRDLVIVRGTEWS
ncbi:hypothetical protein [Corynebacterium lujinxingii]|uniref:hypothetical protein n=1 Tax=Corynebacterium lujinxingii TaxID=2763010 RepID=UPI001E452AC5|nr:hypothetical protein [Corynebacterium lujinxingii]